MGRPKATSEQIERALAAEWAAHENGLYFCASIVHPDATNAQSLDEYVNAVKQRCANVWTSDGVDGDGYIAEQVANAMSHYPSFYRDNGKKWP